MPNAVAGNLHCLAVQWCMLGRKEVDRGHGVKRILLAKSIHPSRSRSAVNLLFNYVEEVSTARIDDGVFPLLR